MSIWQGLVGQDRVVAVLQRAIARDRVPHAYLFSGPAGAPMLETAMGLTNGAVDVELRLLAAYAVALLAMSLLLYDHLWED